MGLFGGIKKLFGGGSKGGYSSPYTGTYENGANTALSNALGGVSSTKNGTKTYYNFGEGFKDLRGEAGKNYANQGYDYSGMDSAMTSFKNPYKFSFADTGNIDAAADLQYGLGAKDINRSGASSLEKIRETTGTRRPGLLMKAAEANERATGENLANLNTNLRVNALNQKTQLGKDQQMAQADSDYRNATALADTSRSKIATESDITQRERENQQQLMNYLQDMFYKTSGLSMQNAQMSNQKSGNALGTVASLASKFI